MQDVSSQGGGGSGGGGGGGATSSSSIIIRSGGGQQQQSDNNKSIPSAADLSYYGHQQSPNSLSNQTSWHSEMDHGELQNRPIILFPSFFLKQKVSRKYHPDRNENNIFDAHY